MYCLEAGEHCLDQPAFVLNVFLLLHSKRIFEGKQTKVYTCIFPATKCYGEGAGEETHAEKMQFPHNGRSSVYVIGEEG